ESTFHIHLIDYEVHVGGKGKKDPNYFKSCNWSKGKGFKLGVVNQAEVKLLLKPSSVSEPLHKLK
ncbi:hypothetical protein Tco_1048005, partial [Tanacetum coccineum]